MTITDNTPPTTAMAGSPERQLALVLATVLAEGQRKLRRRATTSQVYVSRRDIDDLSARLEQIHPGLIDSAAEIAEIVRKASA